jgi:hypothetical protein
MATKTKTETVTQEEIDRLKAWIEDNNYTVYTVLRHVSKSGMQREISVVIPIITGGDVSDGDNPARVQQFVHPSYIIAALLGRRYTEAHGHNAVVCGGCGMDMGFDLVYNLSARLYGDGYKIRQEWI